MECRCTTVEELYGTEAEDYAAGHLSSDPSGDLVCSDTGARWTLDFPDDPESAGGQARLRKISR